MHVVSDNFYVKSRVIVLTNTVIKWIRIENCFPEIIRKENICVNVSRLNETTDKKILLLLKETHYQ